MKILEQYIVIRNLQYQEGNNQRKKKEKLSIVEMVQKYSLC